MELFVYDWFYNGYAVYGHCLDDGGRYHLLTVRDFHPSCYVEGDGSPRSSVVPFQVEHRQMLSSRDVSSSRPFTRLYFSNAREMEEFAHGYRASYMADIPQVSMFLAEVGADHVGWVRCDVRCRMSEIRSVPDKIPFSDPRVLAFDIEVRSMSGMCQAHRMSDTVEMVSVVVFGGGRNTNIHIIHTREPFCMDGVEDVVCEDEMELITKFFAMIGEEDPTVITGFNIYGFDIHYLVSRLKLRLAEIPDISRGLKNNIELIRVDWTSDAYGHNKYDRLVIGGRVILDMYLYFKRMKLDKYSLEFVASKFLGEGKDDMPYEKMAEAFESGDHDVLCEVARYCVKDSVLVMRLFVSVQMWIDACEMSKITRCGMEEIYTRGEQMKMVSQCVAECAKRNIVMQPQFRSEWRQYEGAYVLEPEKGVYEGCSILDFQSLYPSIIIAYNICPSTYVRAAGVKSGLHVCGDHHFKKDPVGLLPGMIKRILDERKAVKARMSSMTDKSSIAYVVLNRRQNALKICANSVYGMMGFKNSRYFGHLACAESVTTVGRVLLTRVAEKIEESYPVKVAYGDTDSFIVVHNNGGDKQADIAEGQKICREVTAPLPSPMALQFEAYCDKVILLTKKRYVLVADGKVSYKGVMNARRDYCKFAKDTYSNMMEMIARGASNDSVAEYVDRRILYVMSGKATVDDLVLTKSLNKQLGAYLVAQPHVVLARRLVEKTGRDIPAGTRLEYIYAEGAGLLTPEEFAEGEYRADGVFYVAKQLATQIDDVLSAIGMGNYVNNSWLK